MKKPDQSDSTRKKYPIYYPHHPTIRGDVSDVHGNSLSSGIYLLRTEAGNFKETRKILVVK